MRWRILVGLVAATSFTNARGQWATSIETIPLPMGSESGGSFAMAVNQDGTWVVGGLNYWMPAGTGTGFAAFRYHAKQGLNLLGGIDASGVSADGSVVVGRARSAGSVFACRWIGPDFNVVPMGYSNQINAVSASGLVVVGMSGHYAAVGPTQGGLSPIGALPLHTVSTALGVSAEGNVVVGFSKPGIYGANERGFRWTAKSGMSPLPGPIGFEQAVVATAVSGSGHVIVGYAESAQANSRRAVVWSGPGGALLLPQPRDFQSSAANGVSSNGDVIVGSGLSVADAGDRAIVWTDEYGARALSEVLAVSGIDVSNWELERATAVSGDGATIVGNGRLAGTERAFVVRGFRSPPDSDRDFVPDFIDNCPSISNASQADCNSDGIGDACDIADGAQDYNLNGVPDGCECIGDLFPNGTINGADLGIMLSEWGPAVGNTISDLNRDGSVDGTDLGYLLSRWGTCEG